ncbi:hypothetical protein [Rhizobium leguminosarum]|uniref:hypothetical protein n=1 Tax=Rhizobium leguminosarum TaxID=384 RepID=UPI001C974B71|nr:hypothetical protein [Rhizobium leguminosarum]MBY5351316.1 hypothetical protein [Rhizobium leguminosarum]
MIQRDLLTGGAAPTHVGAGRLGSARAVSSKPSPDSDTEDDQMLRIGCFIAACAFATLTIALLPGHAVSACQPPRQVTEATPDQVRAFFNSKHAEVVTFLGYSGAGYEDADAILGRADAALKDLDPKHWIVNIGATEEGIGAVYEIAKQRGFTTSGIVSTQARDEKVALSPCVDFVFYVEDATWGGYLPDKKTLSPTSMAMVAVSDTMIAIGGGAVARDEVLEARRLGKKMEFIPADMNHRVAREKAARQGQPEPTDFRGAADAALRSGTP